MSRASAGRARARSDVGSAVNAAARSESSFAGRARMASTTAEFASVTRRPRSAKFAAARRAPALKTRRLRAGEIQAAGGAIVLGPQRRLVERRQCLSAGRAAVEQAAPVARAGDRRREAPLPPEIRLLVFGQTLRTELQPGGLPPPPPARRKIGAQRQQKRARPNPSKGHAADRLGREARAADQPIPHDWRQREIEPAGPGAGTQIERGSERPGRQAVADGQPMQPAREQFVGLRSRDDRPMARQEVVGHGAGLRWRAIPDPSTSSQQSVALRRAAPARKRDMREGLDRGRS